MSQFNNFASFAGLAVTTVMFVTTCLMVLVILIVWKQGIIKAITFLFLFGSIELLYMSASISKIPQGGWIPLVLALTFTGIMYTWNFGTMKKHQFDVENKVSMDRILSVGPSLGITRVPGIGFIYTNLASGIPAIFGHFVTNLPAFHQVLVFVCIKSVQIPHVGENQRLLISRIGPKEYGMFRCIVRYGYKDIQQENYNFENKLLSGVVQFVESEKLVPESSTHEMSAYGEEENMVSSSSGVLRVVKNNNNDEHLEECLSREESMQIMKAREAGVAYILGHSHAKAKKSSSMLKKVAIDVVFSFLSKNCRQPDVILKVPHASLLEVGMVYYV